VCRVQEMFRSIRGKRPRKALILAGLACAVLALSASPRARHEVAVLSNTAQAALIHAGVMHLGQLAVSHVRPQARGGDIAAAQDWWPTQSARLPATGPYIGPFGEKDGTILFAPDIPEAATEAVIALDLHLFGSWDARHAVYGGVEGDGIVFGINGVPFHRALFQNWGRSETYRSTRVQIGDTTYALGLVRNRAGQDYRGVGRPFDSTWSLRLEAEGHPAHLHLSLHGTANDPSDEFFALANVQVFYD